MTLRLFDDPRLEALSKVHPAVPALFWGPLAGYLLSQSRPSTILPWGLLGWGTWSLTEYALHRWLFHCEWKNPTFRRVRSILHDNHHDVPDDSYRLLMPLAPSVVFAAIFFLLFRSILGRELASPFFAAFLVGYLAYDYTHFAIHHSQSKSTILRALKRHHMLHHFAEKDRRFGVSSPLWDRVFKTS